MPDAISNSSPLLHLHQTNQLNLLPALYGRVVLPQAVADELERGITLGLSLPVISDLDWIQVRASHSTMVRQFSAGLGMGERAVLALAEEVNDPLLLLDDRRARQVAKERGFALTGTLGILLKGKQAGMLREILSVIDQLETLGFRLRPATRLEVLNLAGEG